MIRKSKLEILSFLRKRVQYFNDLAEEQRMIMENKDLLGSPEEYLAVYDKYKTYCLYSTAACIILGDYMNDYEVKTNEGNKKHNHPLSAIRARFFLPKGSKVRAAHGKL